jgi:putative radical SAM enzyme (TIGR03279 family)
MTAPIVVAVAPGSPAATAGVQPGDAVLRLNGRVPRDVIEWHLWADEPDIDLLLLRNGIELELAVDKAAGQPLGAEVSSALFDRVRTCDNHCEFCFIYQLPKGMRRSLYLKDDDYRLSFLYGNFTTLTRFTEADLERVVTERLSPLHVSIHSTDPELRATMLRNRRGATSLRWLRALLDHGIEVRGQVVVCPSVNDGARLDETFAGILDEYPELATVAVVPLGISRFNPEASLREHTRAEAAAVIEAVTDWQDVFEAVLGRRLVHAADEYYLMAGRDFPSADRYEGFPMHEDGVGMARTFEAEFHGHVADATGTRRGFFAAVDTPRNPTDYRTPCHGDGAATAAVTLAPRRSAPVGILSGELGADVLRPLVASLGRDDVRVIPVVNEFFGGNTGVSGLMVGADLARVLAAEPAGHRYLLPDVCLSDDGRFLDGATVGELPRHVEVIPTDGHALRQALDGGGRDG